VTSPLSPATHHAFSGLISRKPFKRRLKQVVWCARPFPSLFRDLRQKLLLSPQPLMPRRPHGQKRIHEFSFVYAQAILPLAFAGCPPCPGPRAQPAPAPFRTLLSSGSCRCWRRHSAGAAADVFLIFVPFLSFSRRLTPSRERYNL